ncbi:MAG TPA: hypothetical protein VMO26_03445 [Vicinamibacterales bacterium]|nr:hypothetical protein [Vicinamibacterales bacterium]
MCVNVPATDASASTDIAGVSPAACALMRRASPKSSTLMPRVQGLVKHGFGCLPPRAVGCFFLQGPKHTGRSIVQARRWPRFPPVDAYTFTGYAVAPPRQP